MGKSKNDGNLRATTATSAARGKNDWGIPDWCDLNAYNETDWSDYRWRWEFYRRRSDIREYFDQNAELTYERDLELISQGAVIGPLRRPSEPGFCATGSEDATLRFGYVGIPNPRISAQPEAAIRPVKKFGRYYRLVEGRRLRAASEERLSEWVLPGSPSGQKQEAVQLDELAETFQVRLFPDEVAMKFALDEPIEPQLEEARDILRERQKALTGKQLQNRRHKQKWATYLRVLDAREAGAKWAEIAEFFFSHGFLARHANPESGYEPPPPQAARDLWNQARRLCYDFPI